MTTKNSKPTNVMYVKTSIPELKKDADPVLGNFTAELRLQLVQVICQKTTAKGNFYYLCRLSDGNGAKPITAMIFDDDIPNHLGKIIEVRSQVDKVTQETSHNGGVYVSLDKFGQVQRLYSIRKYTVVGEPV